MSKKKLTVNWAGHDQKVLDYILAKLGVTDSVLLPNRTDAAVQLRSQIYAMLRAARTPHCVLIPWIRIRDICKVTHHSGLIRAVRIYQSKHGVVEPFNVPSVPAPHRDIADAIG